MRPDRTLPLALSLPVLAALVSGCAEELVDTGSEPLVGESADTPLGLAADGDGGDTLPAWEGEDSLPPWEGEGPPPWEGDIPGEPDSIVHPTRGRIDLTITATGPLLPGEDVTLTIKGVAREPIDSGEVVLTLPTRALMGPRAGHGRPGAAGQGPVEPACDGGGRHVERKLHRSRRGRGLVPGDGERLHARSGQRAVPLRRRAGRGVDARLRDGRTACRLLRGLPGGRTGDGMADGAAAFPPRLEQDVLAPGLGVPPGGLHGFGAGGLQASGGRAGLGDRRIPGSQIG